MVESSRASRSGKQDLEALIECLLLLRRGFAHALEMLVGEGCGICLDSKGVRIPPWEERGQSMKIKRPIVKKLLRTLEDARILVDEGTPIGGYRQRKLEDAYDAICSAEEILRRTHDDSRKCRSKGSL